MLSMRGMHVGMRVRRRNNELVGVLLLLLLPGHCFQEKDHRKEDGEKERVRVRVRVRNDGADPPVLYKRRRIWTADQPANVRVFVRYEYVKCDTQSAGNQ